MNRALTTTGGVENRNRKVVGGLLVTRIFDRVTDKLVRTDIADLHRQIPSLGRALESSILQLDFARQLPPGLMLNFSQVEHLDSHAIGIVAFLARISPIVDSDTYEELAPRLGARIHRLLSEVLFQRANSGSTNNIPLGIENAEEAGRFLATFNSCFHQGADLANLNPQTNSISAPIRIMPIRFAKSVGQSGPIVERICTIDRIDKSTVWATNIGFRGNIEIQYSDGIEGYMLQLIKASRKLVKLKLAPITFPEHSADKEKFRQIEICGVEPAQWEEIARNYVSAAESLLRLPEVGENSDSEAKSLANQSATGKSHATTMVAWESSAGEPRPSGKRRNRRNQEPL